MTEIKNFQINTNGVFSIKEKKKDFYQMIFGGIFIFYIPMLWATKFTIDSKGYFIFMAIFLTMLYIFASIIVPISLMVRINKVIRQINFDDNQIWFISNKKHCFNRSDIRFKVVKNRFTGFSVRNKDGILLTTVSGKEYWIIEDFYTDFDELQKILMFKSETELSQ